LGIHLDRAASDESGELVIHAEELAGRACRVRPHGEADLLKHLLRVAPSDVCKLGVRRDGDDLDSQRMDLVEVRGDVGQFRGADEGEVRRVEHQHRPQALRPKLVQGHAPKHSRGWLVGLDRQVRHVHADQDCLIGFLFHGAGWASDGVADVKWTKNNRNGGLCQRASRYTFKSTSVTAPSLADFTVAAYLARMPRV
jgi:hypothetical protein